ncbi:ComEC/Rec2 family competence protein [Candidatus Chlamydia sanziniae]|uniref:Competence locus E-like protein n=1 Tax=Candidatus Chlamydia sanziniae TaxID=1806891 RepID=A0A1A9HVX4_9CHLA|nr:ComEC/Rec2 family competence protein [Candidatus Chlamydia sanziniae]ANH78194.1 competence locus E-like protein [Candidatus Chlamydia sanziniae]
MQKYFQNFSSFFSCYPLGSWLTQLRITCQYFQEKHPTFLCALYWLAGILARTHADCCILILVFLHPFLPRNPKQWFPLGLCWLVPLLISSPPFSHEGSASGIFKVSYKGWGKTYYGEAIYLSTPCGKQTRHLSCKILSSLHLEPKKTYHLQGTLYHTSQNVFKSNSCYKEIPKSKFITTKEKLRETTSHYLISLFDSSQTGKFVSSLLLGTPLPKDLQELFRNKGLSHLFAVSGWHFSLFSSIFWVFFSFFPIKIKNFVSFVILTSLTLLFPTSPSVWRAWIALSFLYFSTYSSGTCSGLNRLGLGFIFCSLFFSPFSPGFALSFLATLGILLFFPILHTFFYTPWALLIASPFWLHLIRYLMTIFAISLSAQIFLWLPLMYFFRSFPLDGIIYNLIFPLIMLPTIALILTTVIFPSLAPLTHRVISWVISNPWMSRPNLLVSVSFPPVSPWQLTLISSVLFFLGLAFTKSSFSGISYSDKVNYFTENLYPQ